MTGSDLCQQCPTAPMLCTTHADSSRLDIFSLTNHFIDHFYSYLTGSSTAVPIPSLVTMPTSRLQLKYVFKQSSSRQSFLARWRSLQVVHQLMFDESCSKMSVGELDLIIRSLVQHAAEPGAIVNILLSSKGFIVFCFTSSGSTIMFHLQDRLPQRSFMARWSSLQAISCCDDAWHGLNDGPCDRKPYSWT